MTSFIRHFEIRVDHGSWFDDIGRGCVFRNGWVVLELDKPHAEGDGFLFMPSLDSALAFIKAHHGDAVSFADPAVV